MLALDTNVLVRYLVRDDPRQTKAATRFIERTEMEGELIFLSHVVVCELVWVLRSSYRYSRESVAIAVEAVLDTRHFRFDRPDLLRGACDDYRSGPGGFADYLVAREAAARGCRSIATFDSTLLRDARFTAPG